MNPAIQPSNVLQGGGWEKDRAHFPEPVTPFGGSVYVRHLTPAIAEMCATFGLLIDGLETEIVGGEVYTRPRPVFGPAEPKGPVPPAWLLGVLARIAPARRRRTKAAQHALDAGLLDELPRRWEREWRDELSTAIDELLTVDLASLDEAAFLDHLDRCDELMGRGQHIHFQLFMPYVIPLHELHTVCEELLGWDLLRAMTLLSGDSPASVAGRSELIDLVRAVRDDSAAHEALAARPADPVGALESVDEALSTRLEAWIRHHGWRTANYDAGSPTLAERPGLVTRLLLTEAREAEYEERAAAELEARSRLAGDDLARFEAALNRARERYPLREENVILADNVPCGLLRRWLIEAGRRLVDAGALTQVSDSAYLEFDELRAAFADGRTNDLERSALRRSSEWAWTRAHPGPDHVGNVGAPPDPSSLPAAARRTNAAMLWMMSLEYPSATERPGGQLSGTPASPGTYTGPVRVILGEADFAKLAPGDVLVCPVTTPAWSPLFMLAGAVVTDGGGVLSHSAIVAREYGLPAILGTGNATTVLADGEIVTVDGAAGTVQRVAAMDG